MSYREKRNAKMKKRESWECPDCRQVFKYREVPNIEETHPASCIQKIVNKDCGGCNGTPQVVSPMIEGKSRTEELEMQELRDRLAMFEGRPQDMGKTTIQGSVE